MKNYLLVLCLLLLTAYTLNAQDKGFAPAFEIKTDTVKYFRLPHNSWQYILEKDALTFEQVTGPKHSSNFKPGDSIKANIERYWIRYKIRNTLKKPLDVTFPLYKKSYLYIQDDGKTHKFLSGSMVPWSKKQGLRRLNQVEYTLRPGAEITVYEHALEYNVSEIYPSVGIWKNVIKKEYIDESVLFENLNSHFLGGFVFFAALINLLFYFLIKERVYVFYAIMLLITSVGTCSQLLSYSIFNEIPVAFYLFVLTIFPIGMFFFYLVVGLFLQIDKYFPRLFRIFMVLAFFSALMMIAAALARFYNFTPIWLNILYTIASTLPILFVIVITLVQVFNKRKSSYLFALAILPFIVSMFFIFISSVSSGWLSGMSQLSAMWGISVVSWSLFQRFRKIMNDNVQQALDNEKLAREKEEERNELIARQNELLEQQVTERTSELTNHWKTSS